jgi:bifunctional non-homologous end joining protein LigD
MLIFIKIVVALQLLWLAAGVVATIWEDLRPKPLRNAALSKSPRRSREGIQYVEHTTEDGEKMFEAACKLGLEGIVSKKLTPYGPGRSDSWIKVKNPKSPVATRATDGTF